MNVILILYGEYMANSAHDNNKKDLKRHIMNPKRFKDDE